MTASARQPEEEWDSLDGGLLAEINVTPFVDVMLVLLVIFMVATPLMIQGVPIDLPRVAAANLPHQSKPIIVSVARDRVVYIGDQRIDLSDLPGRLQTLRSASGDLPVYLRADRGVSYGAVVDVLGCFGASGFTRVSMLTEPAPGGTAQ